jgi:hypothetical protein
MIGSLARSTGAILVGLLVAAAFSIGVEGLSSILHPFPPGVDCKDPEVCRVHVARYPPWVLSLCGLGWVVGTFVSAWVATRLGSDRHPAHAIGTGLLLLTLIVANMLMLPYPAWFWVQNLVGIPLAFYLGAWMGRARAPTA